MLKPSSRSASPVILPSARAGQIAVFPNCSRRRHGRKDFPQPVNQPAFLINTEERISRQKFAHAVEQLPQLLRAANVAPEDDHAARLNFLNQGARFRVELSARQADIKELSDLLFERERQK